MNKTIQDNFNNLEQKAERFIRQTAVKYFAVGSSSLPDKGGVIMVSLKKGKKKERYLSVDFTNSLRNELQTKRAAFIASYRGNNIIYTEGKGVRFVDYSESLQYMKDNCLLRFIVEPDVKERLALTAVVSTIIYRSQHKRSYIKRVKTGKTANDLSK
ncbi:MAG TPA: hypothetical protein VEC12_08585 [Bacteroidia bacterium]|nr:hypothetical protein [Bacteroidia bacterium]